MRLSVFALSIALASPLVSVAQTPAATPETSPVPVTSQTPAATNGASTTAGVAVPDAATGAPMTGKERRAQHKRQRQQQAAADKEARAARKDTGAAQPGKASNATQQAQPH